MALLTAACSSKHFGNYSTCENQSRSPRLVNYLFILKSINYSFPVHIVCGYISNEEVIQFTILKKVFGQIMFLRTTQKRRLIKQRRGLLVVANRDINQLVNNTLIDITVTISNTDKQTLETPHVTSPMLTNQLLRTLNKFSGRFFFLYVFPITCISC